jgi:hypothetical protein
LKEQREFRICGEGVDGFDAIGKAEDLKPDLIILDAFYATHERNRSCAKIEETTSADANNFIHFESVTDFERSRMAADPILDLEAGNELEFAFIVGDEREPSGFGVSSNPEIIAAYPLTVSLQRRTDLAVDCRRFAWQGKHRQNRYKARERFLRVAALLASLGAIK